MPCSLVVTVLDCEQRTASLRPVRGGAYPATHRRVTVKVTPTTREGVMTLGTKKKKCNETRSLKNLYFKVPAFPLISEKIPILDQQGCNDMLGRLDMGRRERRVPATFSRDYCP